VCGRGESTLPSMKLTVDCVCCVKAIGALNWHTLSWRNLKSIMIHYHCYTHSLCLFIGSWL